MPKKRLHAKLPPAARLRTIRERLAKESTASIATMAAEMGVSEMTVRRDMERLARNGDARRTHGGLVVAERMMFEFEYAARQLENTGSKRAIAAAARHEIKCSRRLMLDTGTTTLELARQLKDCVGATIITPSLAVASELQFCETISVILLGGMIHKGSPDLTGPLTEHGLDLFAVDWVFQGAEAIGTDGSVYNVDLQLARVDRRMRQQAANRCLLADSSKIGRTALVKTGSLADFDLWITDRAADPAFVRRVRRGGCRVLAV
jgi:DeoR/GlpR family transcriptional regulator of sugar metabolism